MKRVFVMAACAALMAVSAHAQKSELSGQQIVKGQCAKCHEAGLNGAPRIDDRAAWAQRMKQGLDAVVGAAIKGHGGMPARGGMVTLKDTELRSAILYMFYPAGAALKGAPAASPPAAADPNRKVVQGTEIDLGVMLAQSARGVMSPVPSGKGYYYINVSLRDTASLTPIKDAQIETRAANAVTGGDSKKLKAVTVNGVPSYGEFFRMQGKEPYTITVQVRRPGSAQPIEAKFDFKP
jgi:cytochrome c5